jgi:hypothetical protein
MGEGLLVALIGAVGVGGVLIFLLILAFQNPDKAQRWGEMIWTVISRVHAGSKRKVVQYGVQSRLTSFAIDLANETGRQRATPVHIEWAQPEHEASHFFSDNRVVIRLHSEERQDRNLMIASMFYVSDTLVRRAKRYLSKRQARSIDLYAVDRLLTKTAPGAADLLHEEVLGPECDADHELADLLVEYQRMDKRINAFFPIFVRELNYLAQKVVVKPRGGELITDVQALHRFLVRLSDRCVGEDIPVGVEGRFLRCAVMIVARSVKRLIGDRGPYVRYLQALNAAGHETIYLVGGAAPENREFMLAIAEDFMRQSGWTEVDRREYPAVLRFSDCADEQTRNLLIVLRSNQSRDYVGEAAEVAVPDDVPTLAEVEEHGHSGTTN